MRQVKTAKGRVIDMGALAKANEEIRAVSNIRMNARGDRLDENGQVVKTVQKIATKQYNTTNAPEKRRMSDVPGNKTKARPQPVAKTDVEVAENLGPIEVARREKTRDDGSRYVEIEYDDGSMEVEDLK